MKGKQFLAYLTAGLSCLLISCAKQPETEVRIEYKPVAFVLENPVWNTLQLRDEIDPKKAWLTAHDIISEKLDIDVADQSSGYLRTHWKQGYAIAQGDKAYRYSQNYKVRATIRFSSDWTAIRLRTEATFGSFEGYDSRLLSDLRKELEGRICRTGG